MKKYVCTVCGYIAEGEDPCSVPRLQGSCLRFVEKKGNTYVTEHVVQHRQGRGRAPGDRGRSARQL